MVSEKVSSPSKIVSPATATAIVVLVLPAGIVATPEVAV